MNSALVASCFICLVHTQTSPQYIFLLLGPRDPSRLVIAVSVCILAQIILMLVVSCVERARIANKSNVGCDTDRLIELFGSTSVNELLELVLDLVCDVDLTGCAAEDDGRILGALIVALSVQRCWIVK